MNRNKETTAEQCPICYGKTKSKPKLGFSFLFSIVRFLVNLCALIDKYGMKILSYFGFDIEL